MIWSYGFDGVRPKPVFYLEYVYVNLCISNDHMKYHQLFYNTIFL